MEIRHSTQVTMKGKVSHSGGLASDHGDHESGHVTVYSDTGSITLSAEDPSALRSLAKAMLNAADELDALRERKSGSGLEAVPA